MTAKIDKFMTHWSKTWKEDNLSPEVQKLIRQANYDLYYGPVMGESDYPGFSKACSMIRDALENLPRTLYVDLDCEEAFEEEPDCIVCAVCGGDGKIKKDTPFKLLSWSSCEDHTTVECDNCSGNGSFGAYELGDWYKLEASEIRGYIVGELLCYIS